MQEILETLSETKTTPHLIKLNHVTTLLLASSFSCLEWRLSFPLSTPFALFTRSSTLEEMLPTPYSRTAHGDLPTCRIQAQPILVHPMFLHDTGRKGGTVRGKTSHLPATVPLLLPVHGLMRRWAAALSVDQIRKDWGRYSQIIFLISPIHEKLKG